MLDKFSRIWQLIGFTFSFMSELLANRFGTRNRCHGTGDVKGKVIVITGANTGIGKVTAKELAIRGANVIIGCRDVDKGNKAIDEIKEADNYVRKHENIRCLQLDLSSLSSVRQFAQTLREQESKIDMLINNAGVMMCPKWSTEDGFEMQFATNHLGHFLLTLLLIDRLKASENARIITVSSIAHKGGQIYFKDINLDKGYSPFKAYAQSKLANLLFSRDLARRLSETNIKTYCLHPGIIRTELSRHLHAENKLMAAITGVFEKIFNIDVESGAQTTLYCALEESISNESGQYYSNCLRVNNLGPNATDDATARRLWLLSCDLVKVEDSLRLY